MALNKGLRVRIERVLAATGRPGGRAPTLVGHGQSGDLVARCGDAFVKVTQRSHVWNSQALEREAEVLRWLAGRAPVPRVLWFGQVDDDLALVTLTAPGTAVSHVGEPEAEAALVATIATLAALHATPIADCPFDLRLSIKLAEAQARVEGGAVDETDFDPERLGLTVQQAWDQLTATLPVTEDPVLAHGDASLPNFVWNGGAQVTLIDVGRFGVADRYQDLSLFLRSARRNHPHVDAVHLLARHYRLADLDQARLDFYRFLDEFF
ncbi:MAG: aminoglycoside 3'-phosphotransferase [Phenylobacterium sp.]|uniref:APH(3') family aminoglycoside O-phosphotransferase n=1 Tax=Phenylobacterium sp. TaxID=1871053 RepID=UPI0027164CBA|nr:APH(3') family aminoglycoside O-phosphotransferase [Phenylobacterium sp.]MDO8913943.1 aminoglycoside 3'-phosphotransferase [Phenylobacterium sp.]MDP3100374.1 aminoglycoside 3'-phosphotransferase [Phenylobacterium sp.]